MDPSELKQNFQGLDKLSRDGKPPNTRTSQDSPASRDLSRQGAFADRFQIVEKIGIGGMAAIYKVKDLVVGEELAIKIIRPEVATNEVSHKRFRQEARAARDLNHPHIVSVRAYDISPDGIPFLLMDFVDGIDLGKVLRRSGPLSPPLFFPTFIQVAGALLHAHSRGVIHRDVKPSNILLTTTSEGEVFIKLVDFGIAKLLEADGDSHGLTRTGQTVGSPSYMSPEQVQGKPVDARSDIYSLGIVMFESVAGELPFKADNALKLAMHHVYTQPTNLRRLASNCPEYLDRVVAKCLEKRPEDRYQNMFDLRSDLQLIEAGREPLLRAAMQPGPSELPASEDWFELIRKDTQKDFKGEFDGQLSYEVRLNTVLERINELGYPGDSILRLQSRNPAFTGLIVIRDGRKVIGARMQGERNAIGYEALRKLLSIADGEYHYFTIERDDYSLPDSSFMLNLKYILSLYPNLPESPLELSDQSAIIDLVFAVESNTRDDWPEITPVEDFLNQLDNRDDRWRPMGALAIAEPPQKEFVNRESLLEALAEESEKRTKTSAEQRTLAKLLKKHLRRSAPVLMIIVFISAMVAMGSEIFKSTVKGMSSSKVQIRKRRQGKRVRQRSMNREGELHFAVRPAAGKRF